MLDTILDHKAHVAGFLVAIVLGQVSMHTDLPLATKGTLLAVMLVVFFGTYVSLIKRKHREWKAHDLQAEAAIESGAVFRKFNLMNVLCLWFPLAATIAAAPSFFLLMHIQMR